MKGNDLYLVQISSRLSLLKLVGRGCVSRHGLCFYANSYRIQPKLESNSPVELDRAQKLFLAHDEAGLDHAY